MCERNVPGYQKLKQKLTRMVLEQTLLLLFWKDLRKDHF